MECFRVRIQIVQGKEVVNMRIWKTTLFLLPLFLLFFSSAYAQEATGPNETTIISKMTLLAGLALLPFAIMLLTSFVKMIVVLSLLRNALGIQQTPPNQVLNGIALLLTIYVMFPTGLAMYEASKDLLPKAPKEAFSEESAAFIIAMIDKSKEPLRQFLIRNTITKHQTSFYQLANRVFPEPYRTQLKPTDFIVMIPSFITSQLKGAFEIGQLYTDANQNQKALADLQAALAKNPKDASALMLMGMTYSVEKDYKNARDAYEKLLVLVPKNAVVLNNLAYIYAENLGDLGKGYQLASQARDQASADPSVADTLGWINIRGGSMPPR